MVVLTNPFVFGGQNANTQPGTDRNAVDAKTTRVMVLKVLGAKGRATFGELLSMTTLPDVQLRSALEILARDGMVRAEGDLFLLTDIGERAQYVVA